MPLGTEVGLVPGLTESDGDPAHPKKARPQFSAHVYCGQTFGWIKMPLGMEVGLVPGDIVLDGDTAPPKKGHSPLFSAQPPGWIKMPRGHLVNSQHSLYSASTRLPILLFEST